MRLSVYNAILFIFKNNNYNKQLPIYIYLCGVMTSMPDSICYIVLMIARDHNLSHDVYFHYCIEVPNEKNI